MQDQRLVTRLENYWNLIRRGQPLPEIQRLNPGSLEDMWQQCIQFEVLRTQGSTSYSYRFMGSKLVKMYGQDLTHQIVNLSASQYPLTIVIGKLDAVVEAKSFLKDENQFMNNRGRMVKYRACFLPFGNETKGITHIVAAFSGREFE